MCQYKELIVATISFIFVIILMTRYRLLPNHFWQAQKSKYYYGPTYTVTGPLAENHLFQISFENATSEPTQRVEEHFTDIYFGSGILRIFHNPLKFEFFPETGENLKIKIIDLVSTNIDIIYCGNLTESDGLPKGFEVLYQGIESRPIIGISETHTIISFRLRGFTRVIRINNDRSVYMHSSLKNQITVNDLTKA